MAGEGIVEFDMYTVMLAKELGRGTFGSVYEGVHKRSKTKVAVKKMAIVSSMHGADGMKEIKLLHKMAAHENIIRLEDFFYHDTSFWIVMEFCEADLDKYMAETMPGMDERIQIMYMCAAGLTHMHEQPAPIIHRDIKPANILIKNGVAKLTDLGVSKMVDMDELIKTLMFSTVVGTPGYMSPEQFEKKDYGFPVDSFAMGLVYLALVIYKAGGHLLPLVGGVMGVVPLGQDMMMRNVMNQPMPEAATPESSDDSKVRRIKEVINGMVKYDPTVRTGMRQVMDALGAIIGKSSAPAPTRAVHRLPTPPPSDEEISSSEDEEDNEASTSGISLAIGSGEGIGFDLLQAALREHIALLVGQAGGGGGHQASGGLDVMGMLMQALADNKFEPGDKVVLDTDLERAKKLQVNHGDWVDGMQHYLGMEGIVQESGTGVVTAFRVKFVDGQTLTWNGELLTKASDVHTLKPPPYAKPRRLDSLRRYKQYDLVQVTADQAKFQRLMEEIGCWREDLTVCLEERGIITKIDIDGDIVVSLMVGNRAIRCVIHPDLLTKLAPSAGDVESGDVVYIKEELSEVKKLQKDHGGWAPSMEKALGKLSMVASTGRLPNGATVAKVEMDGDKWYFNPKAFVVLAKSEDLFQALIAREVAKHAAAAASTPAARADKKTKCVIQ